MPKHEDIYSPAEISNTVHTHILNYIAGLCPKKSTDFVKAKTLLQSQFCWSLACCAKTKDKLTKPLGRVSVATDGQIARPNRIF